MENLKDSKIMWRIDCHIHTKYSPDGILAIPDVLKVSKQKHLNGTVVTDHNTIEGALELKAKASNDFIVVIGEEIETAEGEIMGFFLKEQIPPGLLPKETVDRIKMQGGLVGIPHPFCRFRKSRLHFDTLEKIIDKIDIIEVFNSRNIINKDNDKAYQFALENKKAMVVGSDAHLRREYGMSYIEIQPFSTPEEFKSNLLSARMIKRQSALWVHFIAKINKYLK